MVPPNTMFFFPALIPLIKTIKFTTGKRFDKCVLTFRDGRKLTWHYYPDGSAKAWWASCR